LALLPDASVDLTNVPDELETKVTAFPEDMKILAEDVKPVE
jgi:hypothetical protein